jgi:hypothetical protein
MVTERTHSSLVKFVLVQKYSISLCFLSSKEYKLYYLALVLDARVVLASEQTDLPRMGPYDILQTKLRLSDQYVTCRNVFLHRKVHLSYYLS